MTVSVVIGRYQLLHSGHELMFQKALENSDKLIVLVGSFGFERTKRNPFLYDEREEMISKATKHLPVLNIHHISDHVNNNSAWVSEVKEAVQDSLLDKNEDIVLVGHERDESSFYLKLFPDWKFIEVGKLADDISASKVRDLYFKSNDIEIIRNYVSNPVFQYLSKFKKTPAYKTILKVLE